MPFQLCPALLHPFCFLRSPPGPLASSDLCPRAGGLTRGYRHPGGDDLQLLAFRTGLPSTRASRVTVWPLQLDTSGISEFSAVSVSEHRQHLVSTSEGNNPGGHQHFLRALPPHTHTRRNTRHWPGLTPAAPSAWARPPCPAPRTEHPPALPSPPLTRVTLHPAK